MPFGNATSALSRGLKSLVLDRLSITNPLAGVLLQGDYLFGSASEGGFLSALLPTVVARSSRSKNRPRIWSNEDSELRPDKQLRF